MQYPIDHVKFELKSCPGNSSFNAATKPIQHELYRRIAVIAEGYGPLNTEADCGRVGEMVASDPEIQKIAGQIVGRAITVLLEPYVPPS